MTTGTSSCTSIELLGDSTSDRPVYASAPPTPAAPGHQSRWGWEGGEGTRERERERERVREIERERVREIEREREREREREGRL